MSVTIRDSRTPNFISIALISTHVRRICPTSSHHVRPPTCPHLHSPPPLSPSPAAPLPCPPSLGDACGGGGHLHPRHRSPTTRMSALLLLLLHPSPPLFSLPPARSSPPPPMAASTFRGDEATPVFGLLGISAGWPPISTTGRHVESI
jgi:hypothetical protein